MGKYLDRIRQYERIQPIETVKAEEALKQQTALDPSPTIHPGDRIEWERADMTVQHGVMSPPQAAENTMIEPAAENQRPIYWERADLSIVGPGRPEFLAKVGEGPQAAYWVVAQFRGVPVWINSIALRSRKAFEHQAKIRAVKPIPKDGF